MLVLKNENGWAISSEDQNGLWHLVFDKNKNVVAYFQSVGITSTQENLFVGSENECNNFILENNLNNIN